MGLGHSWDQMVDTLEVWVANVDELSIWGQFDG